MELPDDLIVFVEFVYWTYTKTMPEWSHEYTVRERVDEVLFVKLVEHIRNYGNEENCYRKSITYYD